MRMTAQIAHQSDAIMASHSEGRAATLIFRGLAFITLTRPARRKRQSRTIHNIVLLISCSARLFIGRLGLNFHIGMTSSSQHYAKIDMLCFVGKGDTIRPIWLDLAIAYFMAVPHCQHHDLQALKQSRRWHYSHFSHNSSGIVVTRSRNQAYARRHFRSRSYRSGA